MTTFGERLRAAVVMHGPLCVGIDPHASLLQDWGLEVSAAGARELGLRVVSAAAGRVGVVKPQVSFFERFGSAGYAALEDVLRAAREAGLLVIADAKRGDIGTTMGAYAAAWLASGSPLEADAVTVSPYLGVGGDGLVEGPLASTFALAAQERKGVFVLAATSNPGAAALQGARVAGRGTVASYVAEEVARADLDRGPDEWASLGLVVGATVDIAAAGITETIAARLPILAPGFGAQGAQPGNLVGIFGSLAPFVLASESRSVLSAGPADLAARIEERVGLYRESSHV
ncbi:MAG: orotidine-5'-phosphate decarboxylase [Candidatus Microbacterium phytovorans]|uniref:Orotidine-5'-phosphate decarboxylase n=1 Tax=Candidatus Microbacterium phytovorans TaxID=3121374 RepID=A0AAJ6B4N3_9MICO|nr:orotidine-5'-phosphate decarboxylase [Microbacterium sp.]WEK14314.1 MAG: orotidine-5'-phosphate decarboxylase [Microbacterium sp.]